MKDMLIFVIYFIIIFIFYEIFIRKKYMKRLNKDIKVLNNKNLKYPVEVNILVKFYKVNIEQYDYNKLLHIVCLVSSIDISLIVFISDMFKNGYMQIIVALLLVLPVIFLSYYLVALFCNRKNRRNEND